MAVLMNSAMMPNLNGSYEVTELTHKQFCDRLNLASKIQSYIGYPQNAELIKKWTGIEVDVNRDQIELVGGEQILVMALKYRPEISEKGKLVDPDDFKYALVKFRKEKINE